MVIIGLNEPKSFYNVGHVFRSSSCFDIDCIIIKGKRYKDNGVDVTKEYRRIPLIQCNSLKKSIPFNCVPIAIEYNKSDSIIDFVHPDNAFYIFGAEDQSLGKNITDWCKYTISIPTKNCLNLAAAVNIVLYDRMYKSFFRTY